MKRKSYGLKYGIWRVHREERDYLWRMLYKYMVRRDGVHVGDGVKMAKIIESNAEALSKK